MFIIFFKVLTDILWTYSVIHLLMFSIIEVDLTGDTNPIVSKDAIAGKFIAGIYVHYIFQGVDGCSLNL